MKSHIATSNRKSITQKTILVGLCLLLLIPTVLCGRTLSGLRPALGRDRFPDADIIYNAGGQLGFVNADGSRVALLPFMLASSDLAGTWGRPFTTGDPNTLIVTSSFAPGYTGTIFAVHAGKTSVKCGWSGIAQIAKDQRHILVAGPQSVEEYSLPDCGTGNSPEKVYAGITGALSPDRQYSAEIKPSEQKRDPIIYIHDIKTGEERMIGEGGFPAWSPDGQWLAYTGRDGLYIVQNSSDAQPRRLVFLASPDPSVGVLVYQFRDYCQCYPPIASWSPDGKWLVYHEYHTDPVDRHAQFAAKYYSIVKVNVETGKTTKLLDGGFSPYWRWPAEEP